MRINKWYAGIGLLLVMFFGAVGYRQLFAGSPSTASAAIHQQIATYSGSTQKQPEVYGLKRAELALQEYQKDVAEQTKGCNCGPEIDKYTESSPGQWCAMFASWITKEAGNPLADPQSGSWKITNSHIFTDYLKQHGTFYNRDDVAKRNIQPRAGDFVIYYRGKIEDNLGHIDVVINTTGDGRADLIGGNIRDRIAYRKDFPYADYYGFLGIGRPER